MASKLCLATAAIALATASARADPDSLRTLQRLDRVVSDIGYRLARTGGDLCAPAAPLPGFTVHDLSQYYEGEHASARAVFGFEDAPLVLSVAQGSPAAAAGLQPGDALLTIDGAPAAPEAGGKDGSYDRVAALLTWVERAAADKALDLGLRRAGRPVQLRIALESGCASRFQVTVSKTIDSRSDGTYVQVNTGLLGFAQTEEQIAAIVAHELAHNILRHRERLDAAGIRRGLLGLFGRSASAVRRSEEEADRLSVYLMDRAGYDPEAIATFWDRYRRSHALGILRAPTHMSEKDRIALVRAEMARLGAMKAAGRSPKPAFMEGAALPALR